MDLASWSETTNGGSVNEEADLPHVFLGVRSARLIRTDSGVLNVVNPGIPLIPGATYSVNFAGKSSLVLTGAVQFRIRNVTRGEDLQDNGAWSSIVNFVNFDLTTKYEQRTLQFMVDPSHAATDDFRLVIRSKPSAPIGSELWIDEVAIREQ
jgi:hypothetical protein